MNHPDHSSGNDTMSALGVLGVLEDTTEADTWGAWDAEWRDVFVVDRNGDVVGVMNLTDNDLAIAENERALRDMLEQAAGG